VIRTKGQGLSSGLNRQLATDPSTAWIEKPGGPSSIWPVERVAV